MPEGVIDNWKATLVLCTCLAVLATLLFSPEKYGHNRSMDVLVVQRHVHHVLDRKRRGIRVV
jgi:hypothetical protein